MASRINNNDVKTTADVNRLSFEKCTTRGLKVSFWTYVAVIVGVPLALRNYHKRIPIGIEYKLAIGAVAGMALSYFAGTYTKSKCEKDLKKQLKELYEIPIP